MKKFIDLNIQRFGSTNKTTHYELSQYVGTDKPTYLGDYNGDMLKIDTAIYNVADSVSGISGSISVINGNIGTLASLTTTNKTDLVSAINEVDANSKANATNIGTLSNLETSNKTTIVNAINEVIDNFKLTNINTCTASYNIQGISVETASMKCASNSDGSIFKVYGNFVIGASSWTEGLEITLTNTGLPNISEAFTINAGVIEYKNDGIIASRDMVVNTNGSITIKAGNYGAGTVKRLIIPPILYFNSNFGDTPTPSNN